jgi:hypothetical protein
MTIQVPASKGECVFSELKEKESYENEKEGEIESWREQIEMFS